MPVINFPTMIIMVLCVHWKHPGPNRSWCSEVCAAQTEHRGIKIILNLSFFSAMETKKSFHGHDVQQHVPANTSPAASGILGATRAPRKYSKLAWCCSREAWHWFPNGGSRQEWNTLGRFCTLSAYLHIFLNHTHKKTITEKMIIGHVWDDRKTLYLSAQRRRQLWWFHLN